jgi:hypothetical protein
LKGKKDREMEINYVPKSQITISSRGKNKVKKAKGNRNKKSENIEICLKPMYDLREMVEWRCFGILFFHNFKNLI